MKKSAVFLAVIFAFAVGYGCSASKYSIDGGHTYMMTYKADGRGAIISMETTTADGVTSKQLKHYCAEPAPDVAKEIVSEAGLKGEYMGTGAEAKYNYSSKVFDLARRSQALMMLREAMYRLCELTINSTLSTKETENMYNGILGTIKDMYTKEVELEKAKAEQSKAEATAAQAKAQQAQASAPAAEKREENVKSLLNALNSGKLSPDLYEKSLMLNKP